MRVGLVLEGHRIPTVSPQCVVCDESEADGRDARTNRRAAPRADVELDGRLCQAAKLSAALRIGRCIGYGI